MGSIQPLLQVATANARSACGDCGLRASCLPAGIDGDGLARFGSLIAPRHRVAGGGYLFRAGTEFQSLFVVRSGSLKSSVTDKDGRGQIMGFHLSGELLGMDAIGAGRHGCDATALEDSELCRIPFAGLQQLSRELPALVHNLHRMMSREIARDYGVMLLLGNLRADERLAAFLLNLSERYLARGYSPSHLVLRMTRDEIGSHLGLKLETVSRTLSRFQRAALIEVQGRDVHLVDAEKLKVIMQGARPRFGARLANADATVMRNRFLARMPPGRAATVN